MPSHVPDPDVSAPAASGEVEQRGAIVPAAHIKKSHKVTLSGLLGKRPAAASARVAPSPLVDELQEYLDPPPEDDTELPVLEWWGCRAGRWPNLAKMVRQYMAVPASSAGVERVFSAAGKMHDDLRKSFKDETLEASILAAFNHSA